MCHPSESNKEPASFPPNVVLYVRQEIEQRTLYKRQLEQLREPAIYDEIKHDLFLAQKKKLEENIEQLTGAIIAIVQKHMPSIDIVRDKPEVTIANILAALPEPEEVVVRKVFHSAE